MAWLREIIHEKLIDRTFILENTSGFEEVKAAVESATIEWTEGFTDILVYKIRQAALIYAEAPSGLILHDRTSHRSAQLPRGLLGGPCELTAFAARDSDLV